MDVALAMIEQLPKAVTTLKDSKVSLWGLDNYECPNTNKILIEKFDINIDQ